MTAPESRDQSIASLTKAATDVVESVNALNNKTGLQLIDLGITAKRNRRMIWALAISLALDIALTFFVVHLTYKVDDAQELTRSQVLCPLYQQFINADTPVARQKAGQAGQDLAARDQAFHVIHHSYDALHCSDFAPPAP